MPSSRQSGGRSTQAEGRFLCPQCNYHYMVAHCPSHPTEGLFDLRKQGGWRERDPLSPKFWVVLFGCLGAIATPVHSYATGRLFNPVLFVAATVASGWFGWELGKGRVERAFERMGRVLDTRTGKSVETEAAKEARRKELAKSARYVSRMLGYLTGASALFVGIVSHFHRSSLSTSIGEMIGNMGGGAFVLIPIALVLVGGLSALVSLQSSDAALHVFVLVGFTVFHALLLLPLLDVFAAWPSVIALFWGLAGAFVVATVVALVITHLRKRPPLGT